MQSERSEPSKPLQWDGRLEPPNDISDPIWNGIYRHPLSSAAKRVRSGRGAYMRPSEQGHSALYMSRKRRI